MSDNNYDVFIAYPGEEKKLASDLCYELKLLGLRVFLDIDLVPGSDLMRDIPAALEQTHVVAVLLTRAHRKAGTTSRRLRAPSMVRERRPSMLFLYALTEPIQSMV